MNTDHAPRLLGDIGGTHARFAWQSRGDAPPSEVATYRCAEYASLTDAIRHYLAEHDKDVPRWCAIGIANPVTGDRVRMTNHHWSFSISSMRSEIGFERLLVINDFTALALALPALGTSDLHPVGRGEAVPGAPLAVLGPGTGLGVSGLLRTPAGQWIPITGEGGHVTLAAGDAREAIVVEILRRRFGHASAERALSGPGLVSLYEAVCAIDGLRARQLSPANVLASARDASDPQCAAAIDLFFGFLGSVAGDLALTLGARGGVYIGGGIVPRLLAEIDRSPFRERFEAKGRFRDYLAGIPTSVINASIPPAFVGAARALDLDC
jgi:glucokinase